jgi:mannitol-specific phosphotransferase system IIBC component
MRKWIVAFAILALVIGCGTAPKEKASTVVAAPSADYIAGATAQKAVDQATIAALEAKIPGGLALHLENFIRFCIGCVVGIVIGVLVTPVIQVLDTGLAATIEKDEGAVAVYIAKAITWVITLFSGKKSTTAASASTTKG